MCQATNLYFDHPYEPDPDERGLYWATRYSDTKRTFEFRPDDLYSNVQTKRSGEPYTSNIINYFICYDKLLKFYFIEEQLCSDTDCVSLRKPENILGMQGQLFSEEIRKTEHLEYMVFPRLLALAERAWHKVYRILFHPLLNIKIYV